MCYSNMNTSYDGSMEDWNESGNGKVYLWKPNLKPWYFYNIATTDDCLS